MNLIARVILKIAKWIELQKTESIKRKFKYCGKNVTIYPSAYIIYERNFEIGDNSSIAPFTTIFATHGVKIGKNCLVSSCCGISSINHIQISKFRPVDKTDRGQFSKPVIIGDNVWIGMNACILPGVTIGENSIIGSGSVITKSVPPNEIWVGNPGKFLKKIGFDEESTTSGNRIL